MNEWTVIVPSGDGDERYNDKADVFKGQARYVCTFCGQKCSWQPQLYQRKQSICGECLTKIGANGEKP